MEMVACLPEAVASITETLSKSPASPIALSTSTEAWALTVSISSPSRKRAMSKSWMVMSRKMPPERLI
ncbi:hypothetical protein D3C72_2554820 [compost metagenome]